MTSWHPDTDIVVLCSVLHEQGIPNYYDVVNLIVVVMIKIESGLCFGLHSQNPTPCCHGNLPRKFTTPQLPYIISMCNRV